MCKIGVSVLVWIMCMGICHPFSVSQENEVAVKYFPVILDEGSEIYDGDTIQDVYICVKTLEKKDYRSEVLWPGIYLEADEVFAWTDIRIAGIDTPEKKPKRAGRTPESIALEKAAAAEAQQALAALFDAYDTAVYVANPELGKYAGRIVADVLVGREKISVASYMLENGHAYPYDGEAKLPFDEWYPKSKGDE